MDWICWDCHKVYNTYAEKEACPCDKVVDLEKEE